VPQRGCVGKPLHISWQAGARTVVFHGAPARTGLPHALRKYVASRGAVGVAPTARHRHRRATRMFTARDAAVAGMACVPASLLIRATSCAPFVGSASEPHQVRPAVAGWRRRGQPFGRGGYGDRPAARTDGCDWCSRLCDREERASDLGACRGSRQPRDSKTLEYRGPGRCVSGVPPSVASCSSSGAPNMRAHGGGSVGCRHLPDFDREQPDWWEAMLFQGLGGTQGVETGHLGHRGLVLRPHSPQGRRRPIRSPDVGF
jgi:hypothetical protein